MAEFKSLVHKEVVSTETPPYSLLTNWLNRILLSEIRGKPWSRYFIVTCCPGLVAQGTAVVMAVAIIIQGSVTTQVLNRIWQRIALRGLVRWIMTTA